MRRPVSLLAAAAAVVATTVAPAAAHPTVELEPTAPADLTHARTDNVDHLGRFPEHTGTAGGRLLGDRFYVTDPRGVYVYDVSAPAEPTLLDALPLPQTGAYGTGLALAQEDPDTDGRLLLVDAVPAGGGRARLHVVDVSDPTDLRVRSTLGVTAHTWTCVTGVAEDGEEHGCAYAYAREGWIVDLTDPDDPELVDAGWREAIGYGSDGTRDPYAHDLTEIRPGIVMTAGRDAVLMDTSDPTAPVELTRLDETTAAGEDGFHQFGYHSVEWAGNGSDPYVVLGTEIAPEGATNLAGSDCEGEQSVIETWDASSVAKALAQYNGHNPAVFRKARFTRVDSFDAGARGLFLDGAAPGHLLYCAHWMELHPDFDGGGRMAVSYYDRGTRFVEVAADGTMSEIGWFVPAEGYSGSVQWIGEDDGGDILYVMDYRRGIEVLRLRPTKPSEVVTTGTDLVAAGSRGIVPAAAPAGEGVPAASVVSAAAGLALAGVGLRRRRRSAVS